GAIGDFVFARAYWNGGGVWVRPRKPDQTELEYQLRNWYYFNWLCGDHIDEQHIHNLDVINWVMGTHPESAQGQGGRQVRTQLDTGQIFDHHMVEFTYGDTDYGKGVKMMSQCRHIRNCFNSVSEHIHGTKGYCDISGAKIYDLSGNILWQSDAKEIKGKGWQNEHHDLFKALRAGETPNEGDYGAHSTMTAILGRMATYSGRQVSFKDALELGEAEADFDALLSFDDDAPVQPNEDREYPVPVPGKTKPYPRRAKK
ncbi:MAG: gfo/Idh/MocA family oxidoreductase, partial [Planctomycetota bacterium]